MCKCDKCSSKNVKELEKMEMLKQEMLALLKKHDASLIGSFKLKEYAATAIVGQLETMEIAEMMDMLEAAVKKKLIEVISSELGFKNGDPIVEALLKSLGKKKGGL